MSARMLLWYVGIGFVCASMQPGKAVDIPQALYDETSTQIAENALRCLGKTYEAGFVEMYPDKAYFLQEHYALCEQRWMAMGEEIVNQSIRDGEVRSFSFGVGGELTVVLYAIRSVVAGLQWFSPQCFFEKLFSKQAHWHVWTEEASEGMDGLSVKEWLGAYAPSRSYFLTATVIFDEHCCFCISLFSRDGCWYVDVPTGVVQGPPMPFSCGL